MGWSSKQWGIRHQVALGFLLEGNQLTKTQASNDAPKAASPDTAPARWHVIDASDVVLGRLASQAAALLRGKHKTIFTPHRDDGDFVIIVNASKVALTGTKLDAKIDYRHSGFPGGLRQTTYRRLLETDPRRVIEKAVKGMLPHNRLGRQMITKLKVYAGPEHPHTAQQPTTYEISQVTQ